MGRGGAIKNVARRSLCFCPALCYVLASQEKAATAPTPTTHDTVARILVDITFADSGLPFTTNLDLTKVAPDVWNGTVALLPSNQQLRFAARALDASGDVGFSGETLATLTIDNQRVQIPLAPVQNNQTFQMPRMFRIAFPDPMFSGQGEPVAFTIEANAGEAIDILILTIRPNVIATRNFFTEYCMAPAASRNGTKGTGGGNSAGITMAANPHRSNIA